jgi:hypothetical protein
MPPHKPATLRRSRKSQRDDSDTMHGANKRSAHNNNNNNNNNNNTATANSE